MNSHALKQQSMQAIDAVDMFRMDVAKARKLYEFFTACADCIKEMVPAVTPEVRPVETEEVKPSVQPKATKK